MFERFSKSARRVVVTAQEEARELHSDHIDARHLLLGLVDDPQVAEVFTGLDLPPQRLRELVAGYSGTALDSEALATLGIDVDEVRRSVESNFGEGALDQPPKRWRGGHIPFNKSAKKSLECALREALQLDHKSIQIWHVVLGVIRANAELVDQLFGAEGAHQRLREECLRRLIGLAA